MDKDPNDCEAVLNENVRKVILVKNTHDSITPSAIVVTRPNIDNCVQVLSYPKINWLDEIHNDILNQKFTLTPVIVCDISDIEEQFHDIYPTSNYDCNNYFDAAMPKILGAIEDSYVTCEEANELIGEWINPEVTYIDFTKYIGAMGRIEPSFQEVISKSGVRNLVYYFNHVDRRAKKHTKKRGICTYNVVTKELQAFYDVEEFLRSLTQSIYGFAGELDRLTNVSTVSDKITDPLKDSLKEQIENIRVPSYDTVSDSYLNKCDNL